ncbi:MAG: SWIM zinc finger family protein [Caldilineaceae bacterium]
MSSYKKGRSYIDRVIEPQRIDNRLKATVAGSRLYTTEAEVTENTIVSHCSCPMGGGCKHVAALLQKWIYSPHLFNKSAKVTVTPIPAKRYPVEVIEVETPPSTPVKGLPNWMEKSFEQRQQEYRQLLERELQYLTIDDMRQWVSSSGWSVKGTRKADLAHQIADKMLDDAENQRLINSLDLEHLRVLTAVALIGSVRAASFATIEKLAESLGPLQKHKQFTAYLNHLFEAGLIFFSQRMQSIGFGEQARIPPMRLAFMQPLLAGQLPSSSDLPDAVKGSELHFAEGNTLLRTFEQLLLLLDATPATLRPPLPRPVLERFYPRLQSWDFDLNDLAKAERAGALKPAANTMLTVLVPPRLLSDEAIKQLSTIAGDETRLEFMVQLMLAAGIVQPGSPVTVRPQVRDEFFRYDDAKKRAVLAHAWFDLAGWNELWEVIRQHPSLSLKYGPPQFYGSLNREETLTKLLTDYRKLILSGLSLLPDQEWIAFDSFMAFYKSWWKGFNHKFWNPASYTSGLDKVAQVQGYWYLVNGETPLNGDKMQDWQLAQGNFIRFLLCGPLSWLGLVDLHFTNEVLTHFRLHGLRDLYLDRQEAPPLPTVAVSSNTKQISQETKDALVAQADTIDVDPSKVSGRIHSLLERIAKRIVTQPHKFTYRLDLETTHKSFEAGLALSDLNSEWKELTGEALPPSIIEILQGWWESYGQVRLYEEMTIIEFGDDHALTEMKALTSLNNLLLVELSPRLVVIPQSAVTTLMGELQKAGYTPKQVA